MGEAMAGENGCFIDAEDDDSLPKFRKPVPSKNQLTQQQNATKANQQRLMHQQQQLLLFEDFSTEQQEAPQLDKMMVGELYQHQQQQNLQAYLNNNSASCFLSEDRPQANLNQSMASTQQDSVMLETGSHENKESTPSKEEMLEMQRKYYFGGAGAENCAKTPENGEEQDSGTLDEMSGSLLLEEE